MLSHLLFCAFNGVNHRCVLLRCAFCKILFVPASGKYYFLSTVCLSKKKNIIGTVMLLIKVWQDLTYYSHFLYALTLILSENFQA